MEFSLKTRALAPYAAIVVFAIVFDQWIKWQVETGMDMHQRIDLLPFLALFRTHNTGIAFSMLSSFGGYGLVLLTMAVIGVVLWIAARSEPDQLIARIGFALIIGGAIGNLIDRVLLGYVVDYVLFHLADAFITVGAGMVILDEFLSWRRSRRAGPRGG
jgi:signal peptidase II